jgi:DUF438 domain-containing protein
MTAWPSFPRDRIASSARSRAILGRKVQHCHPPKSVDVVNRILDDFRQGRQNVAEFWIQHHGRFVHIRYFAVRDEEGTYLGTLEVTQDLTRLRTLEGERRLLQYDSTATKCSSAAFTRSARCASASPASIRAGRCCW